MSSDVMMQVLFYTIMTIFLATAIITLLGITKKLVIPPKYLTPLFSSLVLELVAAVLYLFSNTNFFGSTSSNFMASLPEQVQGMTSEQTLRKIDSVVTALNASEVRVLEMVNEHSAQSQQIESLESKLQAWEDMRRDNFLVKMALLNSEVSRYGTSISLNVDDGDEQKRSACRQIQGVLQELGHYPGPLDGNVARTREALVAYQQSKGFQTVGYFAWPTVLRMIEDYLLAGSSIPS